EFFVICLFFFFLCFFFFSSRRRHTRCLSDWSSDVCSSDLFAESIWITCCSGRRQISKRSCSISGPTSTTIARIPHGKGEHPRRRCHDQSQISARLAGSPIVDPYFRPQWLPNFSNIRAH